MSDMDFGSLACYPRLTVSDASAYSLADVLGAVTDARST